jgi:hypothetical protein
MRNMLMMNTRTTAKIIPFLMFFIKFSLVSGEFTCVISSQFDCSLINVSISQTAGIASQINVESINLKLVEFDEKVSLPQLFSAFAEARRVVVEFCLGCDKLSRTLIHKSWVELKVEHSDLTSVQGERFPEENRLEKLFLSHNQIKTVDKNAFSNLRSAILIDLRSNQISSLGEDTFAGCIELQVVNLTANFLKTIQFKLLSRNLKLVNVAVAENEIRSIEDGARLLNRMKNLTMVDFSGNSCVDLRISRRAGIVGADLFLEFEECWRNFVIVENQKARIGGCKREEVKGKVKRLKGRIEGKRKEIKLKIQEIEKLVREVEEFEINFIPNYRKWKNSIEGKLEKVKEDSEKPSFFIPSTSSHHLQPLQPTTDKNQLTPQPNTSKTPLQIQLQPSHCHLTNYIVFTLLALLIPTFAVCLFEPRDFILKLLKLLKQNNSDVIPMQSVNHDKAVGSIEVN